MQMDDIRALQASKQRFHQVSQLANAVQNVQTAVQKLQGVKQDVSTLKRQDALLAQEAAAQPEKFKQLVPIAMILLLAILVTQFLPRPWSLLAAAATLIGLLVSPLGQALAASVGKA